MYLESSSAESGARARPGAFSLPEVLIGILVMGVVVVALYTAFAHGARMMQMAREDLRATQILTEKCEALRLAGWNVVASNLPPTFTANYEPGATNSTVVYAGTISLVDAPTASGYNGRLKEARIQVTWKTGKLARQRELRTYVARYGLQSYVD